VRLASPIGSAADSSVNLSNVAKLAAHPKFVWVLNANCDGTVIYNDPVYSLSNVARLRHIQNLCEFSSPTAIGQSFIMTCTCGRKEAAFNNSFHY
jgi:hypothetical protein